MSDVGGMREIAAEATEVSMRSLLGSDESMKRCRRDSEAVIAAVLGTASATGSRAEKWLTIALAMAAISSVGGRDAPGAGNTDTQLHAALGMVDGIAAITAVIVRGMFGKAEELDHAVKH